MAEFPKISWKNFDGWVPTNETDDVDIQTKFATEMSNIRFKNGFIENDVSIMPAGIAVAVSTEISNGYSLLSVCVFTHSEQGDQFVYVLWKAGAAAADKLKIYRNDESTAGWLNLDEQSSDVEFSDQPTEINYNLVNDQLKINLNTIANYGSVGDAGSGTNVILNLTLVYLDARVYNSTNNIDRVAGWYLFPRWLGWTTNIALSDDVSVGPTVEDFENTSYEFGLALGDFSRSNDDAYLGSYSAKLPASLSPTYKSMSLSLTNPKTLTFFVKNLQASQYPVVQCNDIVYYVTSGLTQDMGNGWLRCSYEINVTGAGLTTYILVHANNENPIYIDNISYTDDTIDEDGLVLIALYEDGQRALLDASISVTRKVEINVSEIDWRIKSYELYKRNDTTNVWELSESREVDDNFGYDSGVGYEFVYFYMIETSDNSSFSLDFNYNLPFDSRVDNQKNIYSEIVHKGRVYFVKDDYRVYQSHIAGNGVIQSDSFPYSETQGFGYFVVSRESENRALAISPVDDLVIFTSTNTYVYKVQASGSGVFRTLRRVSGSIGLAARNSLIKTKGGHPATEGLLWYDYNGIYFYGGGVEPPINILEPAHKRYWQETFTNSHKDNGIGFYNIIDNEYVAVVNGKMLTFELKFNKFKVHDLGSDNIDEYVGVLDNIIYVRDGDTIKSLSKNPSPFNVKLNYSSAGDEYADKIMQEFYIIFGPETNATATVTITIYYDNFTLISFDVVASKKYHILPTPIVRFKKATIKVACTESKVVTINDLGLSYIPDMNNAVAQNA